MNKPLHHELKKEFQLERMIFFSDAVFAIAITLLAIEIRVPEIDSATVTDHLLLEKLIELIPKFIGFFVSFFVIAIYWVVHHRTFGYVINYNLRLLWLNLFFLLAIVIMPFSSGFYSTYVSRGTKLPVIIYVGNVIYLVIMSLIVWEYIANPKHALSEGITPEMKKYFRFRATVPVFVFLLLALVYFYITPQVAIFLPLTIPFIIQIIKRIIFKPKKIKK